MLQTATSVCCVSGKKKKRGGQWWNQALHQWLFCHDHIISLRPDGAWCDCVSPHQMAESHVGPIDLLSHSQNNYVFHAEKRELGE